MIYEPVYVDQQEASTSGMLNDLQQIQIDNNAQVTVDGDQKCVSTN